MIGIFLLLLSVAHGEEPIFTTLKEGEAAPFDGRLLNNAAIARLIVDKQFKDNECQLSVDYDVGLMKATEQYKYDILYAKCEAGDQRLNDLLEIRQEELEFLRKQYDPPKTAWWVAAGFAMGAATSIGIMYVVK